jgi:universal stress protein E
MHNQARLTVIEMLEEFNNITRFFGHDRTPDVLEAHLKKKRDSLHALLEPYRKDVEMDVIVGRGKAFFEIIRAVLHHNFDLVVKTCHQHGSLKAMLFGTTDMHLLRKCPCPVWLIKPQDEIKCQSILAAVDIEPSIEIEKMDALNRQILEMANSLALSEQAELHIVHAWMVFGEYLLQSSLSEHLEEEVSAWMEDPKMEIKTGLDVFKAKLDQVLGEKGADYLHPEVHFVEGDAYEIIPRLAEDKKVDLVIMGTNVRTGLPGFFMGNTAESILNQLIVLPLLLNRKALFLQ